MPDVPRRREHHDVVSEHATEWSGIHREHDQRSIVVEVPLAECCNLFEHPATHRMRSLGAGALRGLYQALFPNSSSSRAGQ